MPDVVFRCDASPTIGAGHVSRCLALAEAFRESGWSPTFVVGPHTLATAQFLSISGMRTIEIEADLADEADELFELLPGGCNAIVIDHYGREKSFEQRLRGWARQIVVLDDATGRQHECDVLVDSGSIDRDVYRDRIPTTGRCLLGPRFALIRQAFTNYRRASLERRQQQPKVRKIILSFGSTDPENIASTALNSLVDVVPSASITVVLSSRAPHLEKLRCELDARTSVITDAKNMAELMSDADLVIGAAGTTAFECALLGLPSIMVCTASNQRQLHHLLVSSGAAVDAGNMGADLGARLRDLTAALALDETWRARLTACAAATVDGLGPQRVAAAIRG